MIIIILTIIRKFAKITINFYNGKINNININYELIETTVYFFAVAYVHTAMSVRAK